MVHLHCNRANKKLITQKKFHIQLVMLTDRKEYSYKLMTFSHFFIEFKLDSNNILKKCTYNVHAIDP